MKIKLTWVLILLLWCSSLSLQAQSVVNFSKDFKKICSMSSDILAKKIFITILKLEKRAQDPCEDQALNMLLASCDDGAGDCSSVVRVYRGAVYKHEGRVIGQ